MITLTLLHPIQSTPVQSWTFEHEPVIRIGRSTDNHVILYSAVVSRHHVEIRRADNHWEIVNLGANGTYMDGKQITQIPAKDGVVIRLARSGPNIQIHLKGNGKPERPAPPAARATPTAKTAEPPPATAPGDDDDLPVTSPPSTRIEEDDVDALRSEARASAAAAATPSQAPPNAASPNNDCTHARATPDMAFCPDCGQPLQVLTAIAGYQVVKTVKRDRITLTQMAWKDGQSLLLKTLTPEWAAKPQVLLLFEQQARRLLELRHPGIPHFVELLRHEGLPYLVLEPIYGQLLREQVVENGPLSIAQALTIGRQLCEIFRYLHTLTPPFVHQDVRPGNVLVRHTDAQGIQVVLTGFISLNLLKMDTQPGGTGFAAPEQQQGHATPASDLFALGPLLIFLLTGEEPSQFYTNREQGFRLYPEYVPGLPTNLVPVIRRLTHPDPAERYATAADVMAALTALQAEVGNA